MEGAAVFIDGRQVGVTPVLAPIANPIGKAVVELVAGDYEPYKATVIVNRDRKTGGVASLPRRC